MKKQVTCPDCGSVNKPKAVACRVCGARLVERREKGRAEPVVLQRALTGELFSAVISPTASAPKEGHRGASVLDERPPPPPEEAPPPPPPDISALLREILQEIRGGNYADALRRADTILAEEPTNPKALVLKADALFRAGRHAEAVQSFDTLIANDEGNAKLWLDRSRIQVAMDDLPGALDSTSRAVEIDDRNPDAWYQRGIVFEAMRDLAAALQALTKALALNPDHGAAQARRASVASRMSKAALAESARELDEEIGRIEAAPSPVAEVAAEPSPALPPKDRVVGRVFTYVDGLDEALMGGIPEGHVVIIAGPPGTLKTALCLSIASHNAAREARRCVYVATDQTPEGLRLQGHSFLLPLEEAGDLLVLFGARDVGVVAGADADDVFADRLRALHKDKPFDVLVIDSLDGLEAVLRPKDRRRWLFRLFENLRGLGTTSLVVAERPDILVAGNVLYGRWAEDFLADGILHLRQHFLSDVEVQRRIRIVKMRGSRHETAFLALLLDEGRLKAARALAP